MRRLNVNLPLLFTVLTFLLVVLHMFGVNFR